MPQEAITFRPRGGHTATIGANAVAAVAIPPGTAKIHVLCTLANGRVSVGESSTAPALTATNYGYLGANVPITLTVVPGRETYLYIGSGVGSNIFYITFGN